MLTIHSAFFDNMIPNWRNQLEAVKFHILVLITHGKVLYTLNGESRIVQAGELLLIPKGTSRVAENASEEPHQKYTVLFHYFYHNVLEESEIPYLTNGQILHLKIRNFEYVKQRFMLLYREDMEKKPFSELIRLGTLQELLALAGREAEVLDISPIKLKLAKTIQQYILENYRTPLHIEQLAELIHRSPNYTISLFKEVNGQSPIQYMHQLRMMEARNLLANSGMSVTEISQYLGYYDTSYFFKMFKKFTSMSPTAFITREEMG
ncbi:AraC family transcriptional regulator [Paenibacillus doosanensis]|uniref:Bifunctional transcriptional activator/DNA repair enzyme AdaA n=1 Tax=Paenibacillus konkukensis TaxID=2020716 RepID=A0ABY4RHI2_9BACL|nr:MULTISPECIES: AraC family transcriptional regulator [Paenibacillus]MCS7464132.1 AraC family transcriptional regulator [Paenibacillus doosanensis]UQZ81311.1 Bifunctional transcriptional activator/DNA repair enzyme AdaA [Paenibacillus konkukensis]